MTAPKDPETRAREWLANQGYALEYATARAFHASDYTAVQGQTYQDIGTGKTREIDVIAYPHLVPPPVDVAVVVECKSSADPWVARTARLDDRQLEWRPIASEPLADYLVSQARPTIRNWFKVSDPTPFDVVAATPGRKPGEDAAYAAMSQVVSASRGLLARQKKDRALLVHPVIVLDGPLFSLWYDPSGGEHLVSKMSERVIWSGGALTAPVAIDLVTRSVVAIQATEIHMSLAAVVERLPANRRFIRQGAAGF